MIWGKVYPPKCSALQSSLWRIWRQQTKRAQRCLRPEREGARMRMQFTNFHFNWDAWKYLGDKFRQRGQGGGCKRVQRVPKCKHLKAQYYSSFTAIQSRHYSAFTVYNKRAILWELYGECASGCNDNRMKQQYCTTNVSMKAYHSHRVPSQCSIDDALAGGQQMKSSSTRWVNQQRYSQRLGRGFKILTRPLSV